ncbi:MAG: helix-turn-helix domain-containing protein, partial [Alphaproteobacteria bacterium]
MPRRKLSALSGVSERYLALLERGSGNISIALLENVANALNLQVSDLVAADDALSIETAEMGALYQQANAQTREQVLRLLSADKDTKSGRVCLIGLRGAGKSTLGKLAGKALKMPFVELGERIAA